MRVLGVPGVRDPSRHDNLAADQCGFTACDPTCRRPDIIFTARTTTRRLPGGTYVTTHNFGRTSINGTDAIYHRPLGLAPFAFPRWVLSCQARAASRGPGHAPPPEPRLIRTVSSGVVFFGDVRSRGRHTCGTPVLMRREKKDRTHCQHTSNSNENCLRSLHSSPPILGSSLGLRSVFLFARARGASAMCRHTEPPQTTPRRRLGVGVAQCGRRLARRCRESPNGPSVGIP